jgi:hypothetical protein
MWVETPLRQASPEMMIRAMKRKQSGSKSAPTQRINKTMNNRSGRNRRRAWARWRELDWEIAGDVREVDSLKASRTP